MLIPLFYSPRVVSCYDECHTPSGLCRNGMLVINVWDVTLDAIVPKGKLATALYKNLREFKQFHCNT